MAPLARARSKEPEREPIERVVAYYRQRASAGLIISESAHVSPFSVSRPGGSGMHTAGQAEAWRPVTAAVHEAGGRIFQQLFHLGRKAHPSRLPGGVLPVAPSAVASNGFVPTPTGQEPFPVPRALETEEAQRVVEEFRQAVAHARAAGFDGVEIHAANGFLIDQFLRDGANLRTDRYGGSIENRARFLLEIVDAAIAIFGAGRLGVRVSPHFVQDGIDDSHPAALYAYLAQELNQRRVAYLHVIESDDVPVANRLAGRLRALFSGVLVLAEDFTRERAADALKTGRADAIAFGRLFIANPDLPARFALDKPLYNKPDPGAFYIGGEQGYIDYPFLGQR
jgi:N-ethylmaleimide reductase